MLDMLPNQQSQSRLYSDPEKGKHHQHCQYQAQTKTKIEKWERERVKETHEEQQQRQQHSMKKTLVHGACCLLCLLE